MRSHSWENMHRKETGAVYLPMVTTLKVTNLVPQDPTYPPPKVRSHFLQEDIYSYVFAPIIRLHTTQTPHPISQNN